MPLGAPIEAIELTGLARGTFYLDEIRLAARPHALTAVTEASAASLPDRPRLEPNEPNPFNASTVIHFTLPRGQEVDLGIYNLLGQRQATLVRTFVGAGPHAASWDGRDDEGRPLGSGLYLCRLATTAATPTRKLMLLR